MFRVVRDKSTGAILFDVRDLSRCSSCKLLQKLDDFERRIKELEQRVLYLTKKLRGELEDASL